ncbi:diguanylate cyclase domain-containing protein [Marinomonas transparens]|uniref:GGDEF domain-containing protein n=1 Tax=Marinomonas transparens TaxID=2795388 RepID=A0A934JYC9_9GAMM|nr:GGDEF domain-containing protein [Marinomonas transparens]MBJ7539434.1 GGDEF domain-containing protein [Marinomonas transparens]
MSLDSPLSLHEEPQALRSRVADLEKELDFIKRMYSDVTQALQPLAKGASLSVLMSDFKNKVQSQLKHTYCLFLICDKDCLDWRLQSTDYISESLLDNNQLLAVPPALVTFAASPSCPKRHDTNIQVSKDWGIWKTFFETHSFSDVSMVSVSDGQDAIYLMLALQRQDTLLGESLMDMGLDSYASLMKAAFEREKADYMLLEDSHRDPQTGLLRRYSFENSFGMVLKDSRRHFQRVALLSLKLLSSSPKIDVSELKALADIMQSTVRDNDLIAHYEERELVMGIRIQNLEDAEVVADKLLKSLQSASFDKNRLVQSGIAIGVAFYPEHSTLGDLHKAALSAAESLQGIQGYSLEFHGGLYGSSSEFYSL